MKNNKTIKRLLTFSIALTMCMTAISLTSVADTTQKTINNTITANQEMNTPSCSKDSVIISYHGDAYYYWTIPDAYDDDLFNERMTMPFEGTLDTVYLAFYETASVNVTGEGVDIIIWDSDGTFPDTELARVNVPYDDIVFYPDWTVVDVTSFNFTFSKDYEFHVGWTTVNQAAGNIMAGLSDEGTTTPNNLRSSEFWGVWGLMFDDWGVDVDFLIQAEVTGDAPPAFPDLSCEGTLSWDAIKPSATVYGEIIVKNIGDAGSLLDWEVISFPEWGTWTFTPASGTDLADGGSVAVNVTVVAPAEKKQEFTGKVKIVNMENASDFCEIDVILKTPCTQQYVPLFLTRLFERFPNAFPLLRHLLGL